MNVDNLHDTYIRDESRSVRSVALKHKSMLRHGGRCDGDNARVLGHMSLLFISVTYGDERPHQHLLKNASDRSRQSRGRSHSFPVKEEAVSSMRLDGSEHRHLCAADVSLTES